MVTFKLKNVTHKSHKWDEIKEIEIWFVLILHMREKGNNKERIWEWGFWNWEKIKTKYLLGWL